MAIKIIKEPISKNDLQHKNLAAGEWSKFSLAEQLGNVGGEISRALRWQNKDDKSFKNAIARALELLDLTIADSRWKTRLKELVRARELIGDAIFGGKEYGTSLSDLNRYFFHFAFAARVGR